MNLFQKMDYLVLIITKIFQVVNNSQQMDTVDIIYHFKLRLTRRSRENCAVLWYYSDVGKYHSSSTFSCWPWIKKHLGHFCWGLGNMSWLKAWRQNWNEILHGYPNGEKFHAHAIGQYSKNSCLILLLISYFSTLKGNSQRITFMFQLSPMFVTMEAHGWMFTKRTIK